MGLQTFDGLQPFLAPIERGKEYLPDEYYNGTVPDNAQTLHIPAGKSGYVDVEAKKVSAINFIVCNCSPVKVHWLQRGCARARCGFSVGDECVLSVTLVYCVTRRILCNSIGRSKRWD